MHMSRSSYLPYFKPSVTESEVKEVVHSLESGWLTMGPKTLQFEQACAQFLRASNAVAVDSCTSALFLSLKALGIGPGDEVITTPLTFVATVNVILHCGATPVLVDVEPDTLNIDPAKVAAAITPRTRAIIPVHYGGHPADMDALRLLATAHQLHLVEDAAHAFGASWKGRRIGESDNLACFSFYAIKNITTGEGGLVTTADPALAEKVRVLRLHGISKDAWKRYTDKGSWFYEVVEPGYKCNMTDLGAALGLSQLKREEGFRQRRREIAAQYTATLADSGLTLPVERPGAESAWHLYPIRLPVEVDRGEAIRQLHSLNIGTSVHFIPVHYHPWHAANLPYRKGDFPITEAAYEGLISLPIYPLLSDDDVQDVVEAVKTVLGQ
jgi:dTDP-4-amino-4,6-dideoxygalactose transaminase